MLLRYKLELTEWSLSWLCSFPRTIKTTQKAKITAIFSGVWHLLMQDCESQLLNFQFCKPVLIVKLYKLIVKQVILKIKLNIHFKHHSLFILLHLLHFTVIYALKLLCLSHM